MSRSLDGSAAARRYYDRFVRKLLADYAYGNTRMEAAIRHALRFIPADARNVLDLGAGLGWSTMEMARHFRTAAFLGVDLSPRLIDLARRLHESSRIEFSVADITADELPSPLHGYDAIVLLDVYEHIPTSQRESLHRVLKQALGQQGRVILTFPSIAHQRYLRKHHPERVQPVDEDVTYGEIGRLAEDLDARVLLYEHVNLGRGHDYVHVVVQARHPLRDEHRLVASRLTPEAGHRPKISLEPVAEKRKQIADRLGTKILRGGWMFRESEGPKICIAAPQEISFSETFIQAHVENLPAGVRFLHGGRPPQFCEGEPLLDPRLLPRLWRGAARRALRLPEDHFGQKAVARFLRKNQIRLVLAEFGPVATGIFRACEAAGIPLVAHFHGADAYARKFIEGPGRGYPALFSSAAAIIAVSKDMRRQLIDLGAPEEKLHWNPCGADTETFQGAQPAEAPPVFVSVGRFVDKKAPLLTLLAFLAVAQRIPEARLVMIGDGPLLESCRQACRALGLADRVSLRGAQPHTQVAETMKRARAFVQHSIRAHDGDSEGTPVAVLEAGASGLPTVATRHAGIPDVVRHGETGFLVAEGDVDDMARKMTELAERPELAREMGESAARHVRAHHSMEKSIEGLWAILRAQL